MAALAALALTAGCLEGRSALDTSIEVGGSGGAPPADAGPPPVETSDQVDLLFVVDNAPNTDNPQALLAATVPYLLGRFAHPACVDGLGNVVATTPGPTDPCPDGQREFSPVTDLHAGVISTSIGGHGADLCSPASPYWDPTQDDAAHLLSRATSGGTVPTYQDEGFLDWDPDQKESPPGEGDLVALTTDLAEMTTGVGSEGCGFESQLESIYRFLVDPEPYASIPVVNGVATPTGTDSALLAQRADFLRPTSALVIVLITGQNDCSTREGGQYYLSNQALVPGDPNQAYHLPRARSVCATNPDDPCCASCGSPAPPGCPPAASDPACQEPPFTEQEDPLNLRCFDQKRRFGIDFLYPVSRYVDGLTSPTIASRDGSMVPNPLYTQNRSPELVMLAGIVGVPWQDVAESPHALVTGYLPASQIDWSLIVGDPAGQTPPGDPLMVESITPRTGTNPPTGDALEPPSAGLLANPINGHERTIPEADDLQYACIFPRPFPATCTGPTCPCVPPDLDTDPICQAPDGSYGASIYYTRALPGLRELQVLEGLGDRATVASLCAEEVTDPSQPIYAYQPAADAILRTLRPRLP